MKAPRRSTRAIASGFAVALSLLAFSGCDYKIPITSSPTRKIDERLLGQWVSKDGKNKMKVRKLDDFKYVCSYDGDLLQAFHSDVSHTPFISAQYIESDERKWVYLTYTITADGGGLVLQGVNRKVIPVEANDSATVRKLLKANLQNSALFDSKEEFTKEK